MNALEVRTVVQALLSPLEKAIERASAPLLARIEALEARALIEGPAGPPGRDGEDGRGVDTGEVVRLVEAQVERAIAALPPALPGEPGPAGAPGVDGRDADPDHVKQLVAEAVAALPPAAPGQMGKDGAPGRDGVDADPEATRGMIEKAVAEAVAALPPAEAGKDGAPGRDGRDGVPGPAGRDGADGKDGAVGKDGRDGLSAEDMSVTTPDDGRTIVVTLARNGEVVSQNVITTGLPADRGVWKDGAYAKGDGVSLGGEFWIARRDTKLRPVYGPNSDWRLAVKKGRDGHDGKDGKPGEPGPEGKPGRDLTQIGPDGQKW